MENVIDFQSRRVAAHLPDRPMEPGTAKFDQSLQCSRFAITSHFQQRIVRRLLIPHSGLLSLEWIVRGFCYKGNWSLPKQAFDKLAQPPAILRYETFPSLAVALGAPFEKNILPLCLEVNSCCPPLPERWILQGGAIAVPEIRLVKPMKYGCFFPFVFCHSIEFCHKKRPPPSGSASFEKQT